MVPNNTVKFELWSSLSVPFHVHIPRLVNLGPISHNTIEDDSFVDGDT